MADSTQSTMDLGSTTDDIPPSVNNEQRVSNGYLSKPYADYAPSQKYKIELHRLKFLKDTTSCKRPPPSLRIRGGSAMKNAVKLQKFSAWETELLNEAIKEKQKLVKRLHKSITEETNQPLSEEDERKLRVCPKLPTEAF